MHRAKLKVLFATSEAYPLIKTGGLGDVSGALPAALGELGIDARLLLPAYAGLVERTLAEPVGPPLELLHWMPGIGLYQGRMPDSGIPVYLLQAPALFERDGGPYLDPEGREWPDNALRFGILSRLAALFGQAGGVAGWQADILHCNDWQTALAPLYLARLPEPRARSLLTIHNMAFQGNFPPRVMPYLDLPWSLFNMEGLEFYGQVSFMKAGIVYAHHVNAVSPEYAREIQTAEFGFGMEGLLRANAHKLSGVLNGIDMDLWNPASDPALVRNYGPDNLDAKADNKHHLQEVTGLELDPDSPLLGIVSRMTWQKGVDLVIEALQPLMTQGLQLVILGTGEKRYVCRLQQLKDDYPGRLSVRIGYSEKLAHQIEAGSDLFLMPSRFEPCGLNQMYSMRYGTPPLVRRVGGLADTVVDATPATLDDGSATGFSFRGANTTELLSCIARALLLFHDQPAWRALQVNGMRRDFSWRRSAEAYLAMYHELMEHGA